ncbi:MAG: hypothetical protein HOO67_07200 [Candidatus Peribacteraceae bacterium]|nr:hypothetical protein [Candidatus Peribacteraceae bacterium]
MIGILSVLFLHDFDGDDVSYIGGDCRPFESNIYPNAVEKSFDGTDQNCDGKDYIESDTSDNDNDGFTKLSGDCDDFAFTVHIGAEELIDEKDNDCDGRIDEKTMSLPIIASPFVPSVGAKQGLIGVQFLRAMSAVTIKTSGLLYDGYLDVTATTKSAIPPNDGSKTVAVKIYLGIGTKDFFHVLDERYLDASWAGKGNNSLFVGTGNEKGSNAPNNDDARERGGVFFAGQTRHLRLNLRSLPVSAKSQWNSTKESLNIIDLLSKYNDQLIIGLYTSAPGFGVINSATLELEMEKDAEAVLQKL